MSLSSIECFQDRKLKNWAQNYIYSTNQLYLPNSVEEIQKLVKTLDKLRVLNTRHTFNNISDSRYALVSLEKFDRILYLDKDAQTVTVEGGITYAKLAPFLHENGYALHNLASLPHISIAGACATATHGSGLNNSNLATAVTAMEVVTANGEILEFSKNKNPEEFAGAVVHLGGIGVVTKLTLKIEPTYLVKQYVYLDLPSEQLRDQFVEIMSKGYSVSFFTDFQDKKIYQVEVKKRIYEDVDNSDIEELFGAKLAKENIHPIPGKALFLSRTKV